MRDKLRALEAELDRARTLIDKCQIYGPADALRESVNRSGQMLAALLAEPVEATSATVQEMKRLSVMVDEADGPAEYQHRLVALALVARQFLRELAEPVEAPSPCGILVVEGRGKGERCTLAKGHTGLHRFPCDEAPSLTEEEWELVMFMVERSPWMGQKSRKIQEMVGCVAGDGSTAGAIAQALVTWFDQLTRERDKAEDARVALHESLDQEHVEVTRLRVELREARQQLAAKDCLLRDLERELMEPEQIEALRQNPALIVQAARNVCTNEAHYRRRDEEARAALAEQDREIERLKAAEKTGALCPQCGFETVTSSVTMESFEAICHERDEARQQLLKVHRATAALVAQQGRTVQAVKDSYEAALAASQQEIERLKAENDALKEDHWECPSCKRAEAAEARCKALEAERDQLKGCWEASLERESALAERLRRVTLALRYAPRHDFRHERVEIGETPRYVSACAVDAAEALAADQPAGAKET